MSSLLSPVWSNLAVNEHLIKFLADGYSLQSVVNWIITDVLPTEKTVVRHDNDPAFWRALVDSIITLMIAGPSAQSTREYITILKVHGSLEEYGILPLLRLFSQVREEHRTSGVIKMQLLVDGLLAEFTCTREELRTNALLFTPELFQPIINSVFAKDSEAKESGSAQP